MTTKGITGTQLNLLRPDIERIEPVIKRTTIQRDGEFWSVIREREDNGESGSGFRSLFEAFQYVAAMGRVVS